MQLQTNTPQNTNASTQHQHRHTNTLRTIGAEHSQNPPTHQHNTNTNADTNTASADSRRRASCSAPTSRVAPLRAPPRLSPLVSRSGTASAGGAAIARPTGGAPKQKDSTQRMHHRVPTIGDAMMTVNHLSQRASSETLDAEWRICARLRRCCALAPASTKLCAARPAPRRRALRAPRGLCALPSGVANREQLTPRRRNAKRPPPPPPHATRTSGGGAHVRARSVWAPRRPARCMRLRLRRRRRRAEDATHQSARRCA